MTFTLKLGGEKAQKTWDALKGQPLGLPGFVDSVVKDPELRIPTSSGLISPDASKSNPGRVTLK